jgi:hypothetical protein
MLRILFMLVSLVGKCTHLGTGDKAEWDQGRMITRMQCNFPQKFIFIDSSRLYCEKKAPNLVVLTCR